MDFIPELPTSEGYDNVLVVVDKLTKYAIFIPTTVTVTKEETAQLFFKHVISQFGIPRQVITDRDTRWKGEFWNTICTQMGMKRSLTTSYHPQTDGQTEVLNQGLEIALRAYIGPSRDDWAAHLDTLALSYNATPHTATGYAPAYLLRGYLPITGSTFLHSPEPIPRLTQSTESNRSPDALSALDKISAGNVTDLEDMVEGFIMDRHRAQEALTLGQHHQCKAYNDGRLLTEYEVGDKVLINPHSLQLLKAEKGRGKKLLMKYDGPFEIIGKISPVAYRLRMPASYGVHPILNIAHLEKYVDSPTELGDRPRRNLHRANFEDLPEENVDRIVSERKKPGRNGQLITKYLIRFEHYNADHDEWKTAVQLKNAPEILQSWRARMLRTKQNTTEGNQSGIYEPGDPQNPTE